MSYYRATREIDLEAIKKAGESEALTSGLALRENRVKLLRELAALMEKDLKGGFLWLDQVKSIGTGDQQETVEYEEYNTAEVAQLRGVLDDLAKEMGGRRQGVDMEQTVKHLLVLDDDEGEGVSE